MEEQIHRWVKDDTIKVKLERGQKGTYAWEITYENIDDGELLNRIQRVDQKFREQYAAPTQVEEKE